MKTRGTNTIGPHTGTGLKTLMSLRSKMMSKPRKNAYTQTNHKRDPKSKSKSYVSLTHRKNRARKRSSIPEANNDSLHDSDTDQSVSVDIPFIDTTSIRELIADVPEISKSEDGTSYSISCIRSLDSEKVTKNFEDFTKLQSFLRSRDAKIWLMGANELCSSVKTELVSEYEKGNLARLDLADAINLPEGLQQESVTCYSNSKAPGIVSICFIEKEDIYKVNYIHPSNRQFMTQTFKKFSMLLNFLQSGDVRGSLLILPDKLSKRSKSNNDDVCDFTTNNIYISNDVAMSSLSDNINSEVESLKPNTSNILPLKKHKKTCVSIPQAFTQSNEDEAMMSSANEEDVDDLGIIKEEFDSNSDFRRENFCYEGNSSCDGQENSELGISVDINQDFSNIKAEIGVTSRCLLISPPEMNNHEIRPPRRMKNRENRLSSNMKGRNEPTNGVRRGHMGVKYDVDTTRIKPLITGYPKISFAKRPGIYRLVCIRACDSVRVTASFGNLNSLQDFLNSEDAESWLLDEPEPDERKLKVRPCPVSYDSNLLAVRPEITFIKPNRLRLLCIPKSGRPRAKFFKCSDKGHNDAEAIKKINEFLSDEGFFSWLTTDSLSSNTIQKGGAPIWVCKDTVKTGSAMRVYLDSLFNFDWKKTIDINPVVAPYLEIHHNPDAPPVSVSQNPKWGRVHRSDDTFTLNEQAPSDLFKKTNRVLTMYLRCSSRSNLCRATCGAFLSESEIVGGYFSCCNEAVPDHNECSHCKSTTSSYDKWHKMKDGSVLCRVCYNYQRKKNVPRPLKSKKTKPKPFYAHNQCQYKLRIELMPDLKHWKVYYHTSNNSDHDTASPVTWKRFTLTERDYIDKVRSSEERLTARQIETVIPCNIPSKDEDNSPIYSLGHHIAQYQSRCKVVDTRILDGGIEEPVPSIIINPDGMDSTFDPSCGTEVDYVEFEINDVEPDIVLESTTRTLVLEAKTNTEWDISSHIIQNESVNLEEPLIICYKCVIDPNRKDNPFSCRESRELDSHIKTCHRENYICCSICYKNGNVESFPSLRLLNHHIRQFHNRDRSFKKVHGTV